jgi:hypothetical protein
MEKTNLIPLHLLYNVLNVCKVGGKSFLRFEIYLVFTNTDVQMLNLINRSEEHCSKRVLKQKYLLLLSERRPILILTWTKLY